MKTCVKLSNRERTEGKEKWPDQTQLDSETKKEKKKKKKKVWRCVDDDSEKLVVASRVRRLVELNARIS